MFSKDIYKLLISCFLIPKLSELIPITTIFPWDFDYDDMSDLILYIRDYNGDGACGISKDISVIQIITVSNTLIFHFRTEIFSHDISLISYNPLFSKHFSIY